MLTDKRTTWTIQENTVCEVKYNKVDGHLDGESSKHLELGYDIRNISNKGLESDWNLTVKETWVI